MRPEITDRAYGYRVAILDCDVGDKWSYPITGTVLPGGKLVDTSCHISGLVSGSYLVKYPDHPETLKVGPEIFCTITGDKIIHPVGPADVVFVEAGLIFMLTQLDGKLDPLDYEVVDPGSRFVVPYDGFAVGLTGRGAFKIHEVPAGRRIQRQDLTLIFWKR